VLKILIADDHAIVRKGLKEILADAATPTYVGEACDGREALDQAHAEPWDLVILDFSMPGLPSLEVLRCLKRAQPSPPVLVLSMHTEPSYVLAALRAGANGYLSKESAPEELLAAIFRVMDGGLYVSTALARVTS
jgi:two-component system, NarL family, invasion response regulator UvrY